MDIALYTLTSPLHDEEAVNAVSAEYVSSVERLLGFEMDFRGPDFEGNLCRTQIVLKVKDTPSFVCRDYFLTGPIGNHHIVFSGDHASLFDAFVASL